MSKHIWCIFERCLGPQFLASNWYYLKFDQARKEDAERKRQDALQKKQERERMLADEEVKEKTISKKVSPVKMTRYILNPKAASEYIIQYKNT